MESSPIARLSLGTDSTMESLGDLLLIMLHFWEKPTVELPMAQFESKVSNPCSAGGTQARLV